MGLQARSRGSDAPPGRSRADAGLARGERIARDYDELRRFASRLMRRERPDHTLSATGLVHEAVVRLLAGASFDGSAGR